MNLSALNTLATRALIAFIAMPGMVAFLIPAYLASRETVPEGLRLFGIVPLGLGVVCLLACVREFYVRGEGTLAPWAPTERLVTSGLYRFSRNPMYLSVILTLVGWFLCFGGRPLLIYGCVIGSAFQLRIVMGEEPLLTRRYGDVWEAYARCTPRWVKWPGRVLNSG